LRLNLEQLPAALERGLNAAYLISGDEPLLVGEAVDAVRAAARAAGYTERTVFFVDRSFAWDDLHHATQSLSLFAERRIIELRMPGGKPDKGAEIVAALATNPPPDVLTLVVTEKLDKKASEAAWVQAFAQKGVWLSVWPVSAAALPAWLTARAKLLQLDLEPAAAQLIGTLVEGNLLAAHQELQKLGLLAGGARIGTQLVLQSVADSARYDVFQLAEAAAAGEAALILWALVREIRGLWQARERKRLRSTQRGSAWNLASTPSARALARVETIPLAQLLIEASRTDRIIKGAAAGDAWTAVTRLTAVLAGALQPDLVSGRVV
jgi:DNA polymerase-3 subunit delta